MHIHVDSVGYYHVSIKGNIIYLESKRTQDCHGTSQDVINPLETHAASPLMIMVRYPQLVGVRICLGVAEAGFFPGVVYL